MAGLAEDEIVEHTLTQIQECYLFELPPRVRAQGWLAADMTKQMWTGRMRVVQRGQEAAIMLVDRRDGKLFAMCKVADGAVERVPDSSRYFVIKIQNAQGRHAFVGLAFDDRNQAFDFNVALQEFKKDIERSTKLKEDGQGGGDSGGDGGEAAATVPKVDLSLKQGEKIKISIGGGSKASSRPRRAGRTTGGGGGGGLTLAPPPGDTARKTGGGGGIGLLAPPPGDTRRARATAKPSSPAAAAAAAAAAMPSGGGPPYSQAPSGIGSSSGSSSSSGGSAGAIGIGSTATPSAPQHLFPGVGGGGGGGAGMMMPTQQAVGGSGFQGGGGGVGGGTGLLGMSGGGGTTTQAPRPSARPDDDDDPFGLGLGSSATAPAAAVAVAAGVAPPRQQGAEFSSFVSSPPPPPQQGGAVAAAAGGWGGLSDMSALGAGLPGGGVGSLAPQQRAATSAGLPPADPFSQPAPQAFSQMGYPSSSASSPPPGGVGGGRAAGGGGAPGNQTVNNLLEDLF